MEEKLFLVKDEQESKPYEVSDDVHCIVCGDLLTINADDSVTVKREFPDEMEPEEEYQNLGGTSPSGGNNLQELLLSESNRQTSILNFFLKLFQVKEKKYRNKRGVLYCELGKGPEPFCGDCRQKLELLLEIEQKLKQLESKLKRGTCEVKEKLKTAEDTFQSLKVYQRDERYYWIRSQILGKSLVSIKVGRNGTNPLNDALKTPPISRRISTRKAAKIKEAEAYSLLTRMPIVLLSPTDKAKAEERKRDFQPEENLCTKSNSIKPCKKSIKKFKIKHKRKAVSGKKNSAADKDKSEPKKCDVLFSDVDTFDEDFEDEELRPKKRKLPAKSKKMQKDEDDECIPSGDKKSEVEDTEEEEDSADAENKNRKAEKIKRNKYDPVTGNCTVFNVTLDKLEDGQYQCQICHETVIKRGIRSHVIRLHTDRYKCSECGRRFASPHNLVYHIKHSHQNMKRETVYCRICEKPMTCNRLRHEWTHKNELEKQEAIATGEKLPFGVDGTKKVQCEACGRSFRNNHRLNDHISRMHEKQEKELCPHCGKEIVKINMQRHIDHNHKEVDKPFICTFCEKRYSNYKVLARHRRAVHEKIRPFKCTMCPREFTYQKQLDLHVNTHLNIRPFRCDHCTGIAFASKSLLQRHNKTYHSEGSNPRRKCYIRGPETKTMEQRNNFKDGDVGKQPLDNSIDFSELELE